MESTSDVQPKSFQVLRLAQVIHMTGLCRSMIYQLEAQQRFPHRIKIGARAVGWIEGEVQEWIAARIEDCRVTSASPSRHATRVQIHSA